MAEVDGYYYRRALKAVTNSITSNEQFLRLDPQNESAQRLGLLLMRFRYELREFETGEAIRIRKEQMRQSREQRQQAERVKEAARIVRSKPSRPSIMADD